MANGVDDGKRDNAPKSSVAHSDRYTYVRDTFGDQSLKDTIDAGAFAEDAIGGLLPYLPETRTMDKGIRCKG
jgi:hypothetical protein